MDLIVDTLSIWNESIPPTYLQKAQLPQNWSHNTRVKLSTLGIKSKDCLKRQTQPESVPIYPGGSWPHQHENRQMADITTALIVPLSHLKEFPTPPLVGVFSVVYMCVFIPGPALAQNTIETHQGCPPQAPLDVTLVTIKQSIAYGAVNGRLPPLDRCSWFSGV